MVHCECGARSLNVLVVSETKQFLILKFVGNTLATYSLARYCLEKEEDSDWLDIISQFKRAASQSNNDELPEQFYVDGIVRALAGFE
jgi:hypothetical protein